MPINTAKSESGTFVTYTCQVQPIENDRRKRRTAHHLWFRVAAKELRRANASQ